MPAATLHGQKLKAVVATLQQDTSLWPAALVALGALFLLTLFTFYPLPAALLLAIACGAVAYHKPAAGTALSVFLAWPAVAYQSPLFAWLYLLVIAATLFEVFENWMLISFLEIIISAPFAPFPFSLLGGFVQFGLCLGALYEGSKRSIYLSIPAVFLILLLSTLWLVPNTAFMLTRPLDAMYGPALESLSRARLPEPGLLELPARGAEGLARLLSPEVVFAVSPALSKMTENAGKLLLEDAAILQLVSWSVILFLIGLLPGRFEGPHKQTIAGAVLVLVPLTHYLVASLYSIPFPAEILAYTLLSISALFVLEHYKIDLSRERFLRRADQTKKFGKFGIEDLSDSAGPASLDEVGGYGDVKDELKDAIVTPLKNKELSLTYHIKPSTGILLFGPPGTGKTMLMRALSKELNIGFYYIKCSELLSEWYGESLPYGEKIVIMENGRISLAPIGEVVENKRNAKVLSFDSRGQALFTPITGFIKHKCTSPLIEVRTRTGRRIRVTGYHSLFTLEGNEIRSIPTEKLEAKKSHIAIPAKMAFSPSPIETLNLLEHLRANDHGLHVKEAGAYVAEAITKIGIGEVCKTLGSKRQGVLRIARKNTGVPASKFLKLMARAGVGFEARKIRLGIRGSRFPGEITIDEDWAFFLGLWVADGCYNRKDTVRISSCQKELAPIEALCRKLFGHVTVYAKKGGEGRDIYIGSKGLHILMSEVLGLQDGSHRKKIPSAVFSFPPPHLAAFLRGYFSGDGGVFLNQKGVGTVEASTVSRELADQLLYLLLCFGIVGTAHEKIEKHGLPCVRIAMTGDPLRKFAQHIGFMGGEKSLRLARCLEAGQWHRGPQIPMGGRLRESIEQNHPDYAKCGSVGADILRQWSQEDGGEEMPALPSGDIHWDRVESIQRVQDEEFVYDISVDPGQNFAGGFGGIFAHNSEKNVSELFATARKNAPCILFFDEIDSLAKRRDRYSADDVAPRVMSVLLTEMDGFKTEGPKRVIVIGATNVPDQLDPAILRPGRLDKIIFMPLPDEAAREAILRVHSRKLPLSPDVNFARLAEMTERFSGADLANLVGEAVRLAAREAASKDTIIPISQKHFLSVLKHLRPSTSLDSLSTFEQFGMDYERRTQAAEPAKAADAVSFDDVIGLDDVREALREAIEIPLLHEELIKEYKIRPARGLLLFGPPGCGKTMVVRAASNGLKATFLSVSGADLLKSGPDMAARQLKEAFGRAREQAPALVFIDEIEALAPSRSQYSSPILTQLLQEMDGIKELKKVMVVGATNRPSQIDSALLRPGRFDKILYIPPPDAAAREQILRDQMQEAAPHLDFRALAAQTAGFSGADLASLAQEAKMRLVRSRMAGKAAKLGGADMVSILEKRRPSITRADLLEYQQFLKDYGERR